MTTSKTYGSYSEQICYKLAEYAERRTALPLIRKELHDAMLQATPRNTEGHPQFSQMTKDFLGKDFDVETLKQDEVQQEINQRLKGPALKQLGLTIAAPFVGGIDYLLGIGSMLLATVTLGLCPSLIPYSGSHFVYGGQSLYTAAQSVDSLLHHTHVFAHKPKDPSTISASLCLALLQCMISQACIDSDNFLVKHLVSRAVNFVSIFLYVATTLLDCLQAIVFVPLAMVTRGFCKPINNLASAGLAAPINGAGALGSILLTLNPFLWESREIYGSFVNDR